MYPTKSITNTINRIVGLLRELDIVYPPNEECKMGRGRLFADTISQSPSPPSSSDGTALQETIRVPRPLLLHRSL